MSRTVIRLTKTLFFHEINENDSVSNSDDELMGYENS